MAESKFQAKVAGYLRRKGCFVLVVTVMPGVPTGTPDILALIPGGGWLTYETKDGYPYKRDGTPKKGAFRPLQLATIEKLNNMYHSRVIWPEIWDEVKDEINQFV